MANIKDVARVAGGSVSTVSNLLNGKVSATTVSQMDLMRIILKNAKK